MMRLDVGDFYGVSCCTECDKPLGRALMSNGAVCPHCGHSAGGTVCDYKKKMYRKIRYQRRVLWFFWWTVREEIEEKV